MKKKRILHLLASNSFSGAENVVCTIIDNCSDKYDMYYCSPDGPIRNSLEERNIKFIPLKKMSIKEVKKIINEYDIDLIHSHDFKASLVSSFIKTRVISQLHCDYNFLWCSFIVGKVYMMICNKFSKIIVVSKEILDNAVFKKRIINKTAIVNNVIDKKNIIDKSIAFKTDIYDLIFVGRLIPVKNPLLFIDIVYEISKSDKNIKACIIGNGSLYAECMEKINMYKLNNNIDMIGFVNNPFPYMKNSKVLVMPSNYEGLGLVSIESMILGTVVVNSGVGGLKSIFDGYPRYICNNINDYVSRIKELLVTDKNTYSDDCKKMIKNFSNIKKYRDEFIKIYDEVLK